MGASQSDIARGRAQSIAHTMRLEASVENQPNHQRHIEHFLAYADAVGEAAVLEAKAWMAKEMPGMLQKELSKPNSKIKVETKVDEKSLAEAKRKITDVIKSIFH